MDFEDNDNMEGLDEELDNIIILNDEDGNEGAQVQQHIKKHMPIVGHFEKVVHDGKMARTGDGQKFGDSLYKPQQNRIPNAH